MEGKATRSCDVLVDVQKTRLYKTLRETTKAKTRQGKARQDRTGPCKENTLTITIQDKTIMRQDN
jgi:hypothetical protein